MGAKEVIHREGPDNVAAVLGDVRKGVFEGGDIETIMPSKRKR